MRPIAPLFSALLFISVLSVLSISLSGPLLAQQPQAGQQQSQELISVTGVVVDQALATPIPHVTIKNTRVGGSIFTDSTGYFNLQALPGDTLVFEAIGYREDFFVVPEEREDEEGLYAIIEVLQREAVLLEEVVVRPFPTQQQFERMMLQIDPGDMSARSGRLRADLQEVSRDETNMQQYITEYARNQRVYWITPEGPPNQFFNPIRWSRFIKDWQAGRFTDRAVDRLEGFPRPAEEQQQEGTF